MMNKGAKRTQQLRDSLSPTDPKRSRSESGLPLPDRERANGVQPDKTPIERCVQNELRQYFDILDGEEPTQLYRMVLKQAEHALISMVMEECRGNQTKASEWLGISRGNLRSKLACMKSK